MALRAGGSLWGDSCLDVEIIRLLQSDLVSAVARECADAIGAASGGAGAPMRGLCQPACRRAVEAFTSARCYADISRAQYERTRSSAAPLHALTGTWLGLYPSSGLELVSIALDELPADRRKGSSQEGERVLAATKLTGNSYMKAGRRSWEMSERAGWCRVQSSEYAGAFSPRWDPCELRLHDRDHFDVRLSTESIPFVRADRRLILDWRRRDASTRGVGAALRACGLEDKGAAWLDALNVGRAAVLVDQLLLCAPLALLVAWHAAARRRWPEGRRRLLLRIGVPVYALVLGTRLRATGAWAQGAWAWRALLGGPRVRLG